MKVNTRIFGEIDVDDSKIITFDKGILGFPELKKFTLLHDAEQGEDAGIRFLQSLDEGAFAMPVMNPLIVKPDYDPTVEDELFKNLGELSADNILVLVTATIPSDLTKMTVNLMGPIVINVDAHKACQVIVENSDYPVKFPVYEILKKGKERE
ncbi:MAG: flagellar assembly protein FliW [Lachnospiraceae bacterium]|nr:flagellar assembly protein FliW [Lachnospiraceae bacterium]